MPADDRVRLDEDQGGTPGGPEAGEPGPEEAVRGVKPGSTRLAGEDSELLAKG